jgi:MFS family permease
MWHLIAELGSRVLKALRFVGRQEKPFKVNMLRAASETFLRTLTLQYQSIYILALGATPFQLGVVNSVGGLSAAAIAVPMGLLADRHGVKRIFLVATLLLGLGALLFASAESWVMVIPAMLIATLAFGMSTNVCPVVCGSCLKDEERATGMGLCDTLTATPRLISPIIGAMIISEFGGLNANGIRPLYYLKGLGFSLLLIFVLKKFTEPKRRIGSKTIIPSFLLSLREVFKEGRMMKRWILFVCLTTIPYYMALMVYVPVFAAEIKHADQYVLGGMATTSAVVPLLLSIPIGRVADTIGRKKVIYVTILIYCLSLLLLVYALDSTMLLFSAVLQGFYMLTAVTRGAMTAELVPTRLLGRIYGVLGLFRGLVMVLSPLIGGIIWSTIGPEYIFFFIILTQLFGVILLSSMPETLK